MTAQILLTVDFMSRMGILHRDIKPANLMVSSRAGGVDDVRVGDFGYAAILKGAGTFKEGRVCGTVGYIAPEAV
jgi:serine/threonine protein kinase